MYEIMVRLIVAASLLQLGMSLRDIEKCDSRECLARIERASKKMGRIEWRPISVFPEEAARFKPQVKN